jgi:AcrR family transcriptional regulator
MAVRSRAGTREERRARIERTALRLFRERGFDRVTVEDVCAAAEVAPATFYRHFGTKEDVVLAYRGDFAAAMARAIEAGAAEPESTRLAVVVLDFATYLESQRDVLALRDAIVLGHPRLLQLTVAMQRDLEGVLAAGLARLRGLAEPGAPELLEAGVGMLVLRLAVRAWRSGGQASLAESTRAAFSRLQALCLDTDLSGTPREDPGEPAGLRRPETQSDG